MSMSTLVSLLMFGMASGVLAVGLLALAVRPFLRCRFRWHRWGRWSLTETGNGQSRVCEKCGLMDVKMFPGFTVTVAQPTAVSQEQA